MTEQQIVYFLIHTFEKRHIQGCELLFENLRKSLDL